MSDMETEIADEITAPEPPGWKKLGGKGAAIAAHEMAIRQLLNEKTRFFGNPSEMERQDWVTVHEIALAVLAGEAHRDDAALLEARVGSRWWLASKNVNTNLPTSESLRTEILRHISVQERNRDAREMRAQTGQSGSRPSDAEIRSAMLAKGSFDRWWNPIEDHQRAAEHWYIMLFRFGGSAEDVEKQKRILHRGENVNKRIRNSVDGGRLSWLPRFRYCHAPCDDWWTRELFGGIVSATLRDVTRWWSQFESASPRFAIESAAPPIPFGLGDD